MTLGKMCPAPLGYLGGKTKLRPTIISCMPKHYTYVEVFCGSAAVFFGKPPSRNEIINDVHSELVNFMKVIAGTYFDESVRQEFISYVRDMPASREAFHEWQKWDQNKVESLTLAQRAFVYYYCIKKGFSSVKRGGYEASPFSKSRYNMNTDFEAFFNRFRVTNAQIEHMDYKDLIQKYNQAVGSRENREIFFFMDPPYFVADNTGYYEFVFTPDDHKGLKAQCDLINAAGNKFLMTYDDHAGVLDLYKDYYLYRTDPVSYSAMEGKEERNVSKPEIFITNYDLHQMLLERNKVSRTGNKIQHVIFATESKPDETRIDFPRDPKGEEEFIGLTRVT